MRWLRSRGGRVFLGTVVLAVLILLIGRIPTAYSPNSEAVLDTEAHRPAGGVHEGTMLAQEFRANGDAIASFTLYLATYGRVNRGTAVFSVLTNTNGQWQTVAERPVTKETLNDNAYHTVTFVPPLRVGRGAAVRIMMRADGDPGNAITWWTVPDAPPDNALRYNDAIVEGSAVFQVRYAREPHILAETGGALWDRATTFLLLPWRILLVLGLVVVAASAVFILTVLPVAGKSDDTPAPH